MARMMSRSMASSSCRMCILGCSPSANIRQQCRRERQFLDRLIGLGNAQHMVFHLEHDKVLLIGDAYLLDVAVMRRTILKRCTRSLSKPRSYEETMRCRFDPALEPMPAEATHLSPPCCISTHRSRVVDPDGPTTFLDHREALFGIPQMTSFT